VQQPKIRTTMREWWELIYLRVYSIATVG